MLGALKRRLRDARRALAWRLLAAPWRAARYPLRWHAAPHQIDMPPGSRILVLAPHMDDESLGCGGTLHKCARAGKHIEVLFLTDGRWGDRELAALPVAARVPRQQQLISVRREEAQAACQLLGIERLRFFDIEDGRLEADAATCSRLEAVLDEFVPDTLFVPSPAEEHADHRAAARLLACIDAPQRQNLDCYAYEVWTPTPANCRIDIRATADIKAQAVSQYASQLKDKNYLRAMQGLNTYRALASDDGADGQAEAFWRASLGEFRAICHALLD